MGSVGDVNWRYRRFDSQKVMCLSMGIVNNVLALAFNATGLLLCHLEWQRSLNVPDLGGGTDVGL